MSFVEDRKVECHEPVTDDGNGVMIVGRLSREDMEALSDATWERFEALLMYVTAGDVTHIQSTEAWTAERYAFVEGWLASQGSQ